MPTATYPARDSLVLARIPAGAARIAAEHLATEAREAERSDLLGVVPLLSAASAALHAAGWPVGDRLEDARTYSTRHEDAPATTVDIPDELAVALLVSRGWTIEPCDGGNAYVKPGRVLRSAGGKFGRDYLWDRGEALRLAIMADALEVLR